MVQTCPPVPPGTSRMIRMNRSSQLRGQIRTPEGYIHRIRNQPVADETIIEQILRMIHEENLPWV